MIKFNILTVFTNNAAVNVWIHNSKTVHRLFVGQFVHRQIPWLKCLSCYKFYKCYDLPWLSQ